jgi:hypothetical protein
MNDDLATSINKNLNVISRALARLCLNTSQLDGASLGKQATLLRNLGMGYNEIAELLNTTPKTISVKLAEEKKTRRGKRTEKTNHTDIEEPTSKPIAKAAVRRKNSRLGTQT